MEASYSFNGTSQYLTGPAPSVTTMPLSLAVWCYLPKALTASSEVFGMTDAAGGHAFRLNINGSTSIRAIQTGAGTSQIALITAAPPIGRWFPFVGVFAGTSSRTLYTLGGSNVNASFASAPTGISATFAARFVNATPNWFGGRIAYPALWNVALTAAQANAYIAGTAPYLIRPDALVDWWGFDDGQTYGSQAGTALMPIGQPPVSVPPFRTKHRAHWQLSALAAAGGGPPGTPQYLFINSAGGNLRLVS